MGDEMINRVELEIVGYSDEMGRKILREAFPEMDEVSITVILRNVWPRNHDGSLMPVSFLLAVMKTRGHG